MCRQVEHSERRTSHSLYFVEVLLVRINNDRVSMLEVALYPGIVVTSSLDTGGHYSINKVVADHHGIAMA